MKLPLRRHATATYRALVALDATLTVDPAVKELVYLRASQLNGCAFCVDLHVTLAKKAGEDDRRLHLVPAWRESTVFTDRERAALRLTEAGTTLGADVDAARTEAAEHFDADELAGLVMAIATINAFNRAGVLAELA